MHRSLGQCGSEWMEERHWANGTEIWCWIRARIMAWRHDKLCGYQWPIRRRRQRHSLILRGGDAIQRLLRRQQGSTAHPWRTRERGQRTQIYHCGFLCRGEIVQSWMLNIVCIRYSVQLHTLAFMSSQREARYRWIIRKPSMYALLFARTHDNLSCLGRLQWAHVQCFVLKCLRIPDETCIAKT